jgi:glycosyltransferase involved in cell wall biosynthesis
VINGPVVGSGAERRFNRHTARFLSDLGERFAGLRVAGGLTDLGEAGSLSDLDLASDPRVTVSVFPWRIDSRRQRLQSYLRAVPWVLRETRRADFLYVFLPGHLPVLFTWAARVLGRPYGVYLRGEIHLQTLRMRSALRAAHFVVATTPLLAQQAARHCADVDVVTPMMDLRIEDIVGSRSVRESGPWRLLFVGRVERPKGIYELLDAIAALRARGLELALDVAGGGADLERCRREFAGMATFHGLVSDRDALARLFAAADLFVLPTHHEGFPRVLYEAMVHGVPVLTTFVGGIPSVMTDGENSLRIPVGDAKALADRIAHALGDASLRRRLISAGADSMRRILDPRRPSHAAQVAARLRT